MKKLKEFYPESELSATIIDDVFFKVIDSGESMVLVTPLEMAKVAYWFGCFTRKTQEGFTQEGFQAVRKGKVDMFMGVRLKEIQR